MVWRRLLDGMGVRQAPSLARHNPDKRDKFVTAFENCDLVAATLVGITDPKQVKRSVCAAGHKWLWHANYGGLPPESFLVKVDPLFEGVRETRQRIRNIRRDRRTSDAAMG